MADAHGKESRRQPLRLPFDTTDLYDFEFTNSLPKKFTQQYRTNYIIPQVPEINIAAGSSKITRERLPKVPPRLHARQIEFLLPSLKNVHYVQDLQVKRGKILNKINHKRIDPADDETELLSYPEPKIPPPPPRRQLPGDQLYSGPVESSNSPQVKSQHKINPNLKKEMVIKNDIRSEHEMKTKLAPERNIFYKSDELDTSSKINDKLETIDSKSSYNVSFLSPDDRPTASDLSLEKNARILNWMYVGQSVSQSIKTKPGRATINKRSSLTKQESDELKLLLYNPGSLVTKSDIFEYSKDVLPSKSVFDIQDKSPSSKSSRRKVHFSESILEIPPEKVISLTNSAKAKIGRSTWTQSFPEFETEKVISLTRDVNISENTVNVSSILPPKSGLQFNCALDKIDSEIISPDILASTTQENILGATFSSAPSETIQVDNKSEILLALRNDIADKLVSMLSKNSSNTSPEILQVAKEVSENLISKLPENYTQHLISDIKGEQSEPLPLRELESDPNSKIFNSFLQSLPEARPSATQLQQPNSEKLILPAGITAAANIEDQADVAGIGKHLDTYLTKILKCSDCSSPEPEQIPGSLIQDVQSVKRIPSKNIKSAKQIPIQNDRLVKRMSIEDVNRGTNSDIRPSISSLAIGDKKSNFGSDRESFSIQRGFISQKLPSGITYNFKSLPQRSFVSVSRLRKFKGDENSVISQSHRTFEIAIEPSKNVSQLSIESADGNSVASNDNLLRDLSPKASSTFSQGSSIDLGDQNLRAEVFQDLIARIGSTAVLSDIFRVNSKRDGYIDMPNIGDKDDISDCKFSIVAQRGSLQSNPSISEATDDGSLYRSGAQSITEVKTTMTQAPSSSIASNTQLTGPNTSPEAMSASYQKLTDHIVDLLAKVEKKIEIMDDHLVKITKASKMKVPTPKISKAPSSAIDKSEGGKKIFRESQGPVLGISSGSQALIKETSNQGSLKPNAIKSRKPVQGSLSKITRSKISNDGGVTSVKSKKNFTKSSNPTAQEVANMPKGRKANLRREPIADPSPKYQRNIKQENNQRVSGARPNSTSNRYPFLQGGNGANSREYLGLSDRQISEFLLNNFPITTDTVAEMVNKPLFANDHEIRQAVQSELAALIETNPRLNPWLTRQQSKPNLSKQRYIPNNIPFQ